MNFYSSKYLGLPRTEDLVLTPTCRRKTTNTTTMAAAAGNGPLAPHIDDKNPLRRVESIRYSAPIKRICFLPAMIQSKTLKSSGNVAKMAMNLALPSEHFKGFRPDHRRRKACSLDRSILPHLSNASQWNF